MKFFNVLPSCKKYIRVDQLLRYISIITAQDSIPSRFFIAFLLTPASPLDLLTIDSFSWMD